MFILNYGSINETKKYVVASHHILINIFKSSKQGVETNNIVLF